MGRIIAFPALPSPYPDHAADLDRAECILLIAIRTWVESYRNGEDPIPGLSHGLATAGVPEAAFSIDGLMTLAARCVTRPIEIHCPRCPHLSDDEKHLLHAASLAQIEENGLAEKVLRTTLLSAQGAEFAIGLLDGIGALFAEARLLLSRRRMPATDHGSADHREAWSPPHSLH